MPYRLDTDLLAALASWQLVARVAADVVEVDRVVAVDVNPMMLAVAKATTGIAVRERPADDNGLDDGSVDVVLCQQGLQVLPVAGGCGGRGQPLPS